MKTLLIVLCIPLVVFSFNLQNSYPVLWRPSPIPVVSGFGEVTVTINLENPCETWTKDVLHEDVVEAARNQCQAVYEEMFLVELKKVNLVQEGKHHHIGKRELLTLSFIFICTVIFSAVVGTMGAVKSVMNGNEIANLQEVTRRQEKKYKEMKNRLGDVETRQERQREHFNKLLMKLGVLEQDYSNFKMKQTASTFLISEFTTKMLYSKVMLKETARQLKAGKVYPPFLDYFNITIEGENEACKTIYDCPLHLATPRMFEYDSRSGKIYFDFYVPLVNSTQKLVEADPFKLMMKKGNETCQVNYIGPKNAIISSNDCITAVNVNIQRTDLLIAPSQSCLSKRKLPDRKKYFEVSMCAPSHERDYEDFVDIKPFYGQLNIYCPMSNYTQGSRTANACPDHVFVIPIGINFTINSNHYTGAQIHITHQEEEDPLFTTMTNWHMHPTLNFSDLIIPPPPSTTPSSFVDGYIEYMDHPLGYMSIVMLICLVMMIVAIFCVYKKYNRRGRHLAFIAQQRNFPMTAIV